jgi:hypothetical protein
MTGDQRRARVFGVLYLITFATSIPALALYEPVLRHPVAYIAGPGHDKQILLGASLELLLIIANIGTAVVIFPILRRVNEELALGYVTARLFECTFILTAQAILTIPEFVWELFLGVYCSIRGFRRESPFLSRGAETLSGNEVVAPA